MAGVRFRIGGIMNSISIDIETFSSNDLSKCGVYKYVEAPDFDILLFGYAVDAGTFFISDGHRLLYIGRLACFHGHDCISGV